MVILRSLRNGVAFRRRSQALPTNARLQLSASNFNSKKMSEFGQKRGANNADAAALSIQARHSVLQMQLSQRWNAVV
jgi:hypothetical protein